jgi:hypothetical protein
MRRSLLHAFQLAVAARNQRWEIRTAHTAARPRQKAFASPDLAPHQRQLANFSDFLRLHVICTASKGGGLLHLAISHYTVRESLPLPQLHKSREVGWQAHRLMYPTYRTLKTHQGTVYCPLISGDNNIWTELRVQIDPVSK